MSEAKRLPELTKEMKDWVVNALALMPIRTAVYSFLNTYDSYNDPQYGTPEEIQRKLTYTFRQMRYSTDRPYRKMILEKKEEIQHHILDVFPLADPIHKLVEVHNDYYSSTELTPAQKSSLRNEAGRLVEQITGVKQSASTQTGGGWRGSGATFPPKDKQIPFSQGAKDEPHV